ncbi:MAG: sodium:proton antiporter, partial [Cryomorphaceae bacterium]|nr:sodium:proton antiporter [Cryomorphaceae bacterium]MBT6546940.1 sodium:proton antiporter [Cryomorphaceae bacterium]
METILLGIFIAGYLLITLEHSLKIDKLIPALGMMAFLWAIIALFHIPVFEVDTALRELIPVKVKEVMSYHLAHTSEILIFLLGAMTIVEIIDYYNGFEKIKSFIKTKSKKKLLWI